VKNVSNALKSFVANNKTCYMAELFTISLMNGAVIRFCTGQKDILFGGFTFPASRNGSGAWKRGPIKLYLGLQSDTMELDVIADTTDTVNGTPIIQAVHLGFLDGATVKVEALYMATYGDISNGSEIKFLGEITNIDEVGRSHARITVTSLIHRLDMPIPNRLIQPACSNTLFDAGCTLTKATYAVAKLINAGSTQSLLIPSVAFSQADGYFTLGTARFTSGANNGFTTTVKLHISGQLQLNVPLPFAVVVGDAFTCYPGCDKLQSTCNTKFANLANFEGMPYVPVPEAAI
jgi:uncharacterized phage protein (TIGR02218 family)